MAHPLAAESVFVDGVTTTRQLIAGEVLLKGWSFVESSGAATARVQLWDGPAPGGYKHVDVTLNAGQSTRDWLTGAGLSCDSGLSARVVSGTVDCIAWYYPAQRYDDYVFALTESLHWAGTE